MSTWRRGQHELLMSAERIGESESSAQPPVPETNRENKKASGSIVVAPEALHRAWSISELHI